MCSSEHRRGRETLPRQNWKATPAGAAQAARRSVSKMSQTSKQRRRPAEMLLNGLTKKSASEHRRGRGTLHQQSRKATPAGAAQAARRSVSEMSQTSKQRRRPAKMLPNGLTKKCSSEHRRGRETLPRQNWKATPAGAAQAARRSVSKMSQTSKQRRRPAEMLLNGLTKKSASEHRRGRGTLHQQSRKATPAGAAQAARRSVSEMSQTSKQRRRPAKMLPNGLTKKCSSEHRRGRGTLQRKVGKRLERRRGPGICPAQRLCRMA